MSLKDEILEELKDEGLDVAEDSVVSAVRAAFRITRKFLPRISGGLGAIIGPMLDYAEPKVLALVDTIDGEDDPEY